MKEREKIDRRIVAIKAQGYRRELIPEDDGTWFAHVVEFPGCITTGATPQEALEMLDDAMAGWLRAMLEDGEAIPAPSALRDFSGKTQVRLGRSLHRDAAIAAESEGVSLNSYISAAVARAVGVSPLILEPGLEAGPRPAGRRSRIK
jgi:predicted RNase H-like HicB family nuclease